MDERLTNREFSKQDKYFQECCKRADIKSTSAQARKFRNKRGLAYETQSKKD